MKKKLKDKLTDKFNLTVSTYRINYVWREYPASQMPSRTYCWTKLIPGFFLSHHHISAVSKLKRRISYYIWSNRCVPQCARQALLSKSPRAIIFRIIAFHTDYGVCYLEHLGARWWSSLVAIFSDQAYPFSVLATVFMLACGKRNKLTRKNNTGFLYPSVRSL